MKRTHSKAAFIRKRVKRIQGRAKFAGFLYFLGAIAMAAAVIALPVLNGTILGEALLPVLNFYQPFVALFDGGFGNILANLQALSVQGWSDLLIALFYAFLLLGVVINLLRAFGKLGWLFKRRASYTNGFNRNMYAMDDIAKRFSGSVAAFVNFYLLIYLLAVANTRAEVVINMYGFAVLGGALVLHFIAGLIGGTVTLFTIGENVEEEPREFGLFTYFVRNLIQLVAVAALLYFFVPEATVGTIVPQMLKEVLGGNVAFVTENILALIEVVAILCIFVLVKHATAATEFNRDCMDGAGMKNFAVFSFFTAIALAAVAVLPMLGILASGELNMNLVIAAAVAFVAFLFDCIVKSRVAKVNYDELGVEEYLRAGAEASQYNNTII